MLDIETAPHKAYVWGLYDQTVTLSRIIEDGYTLCWSAKWLRKRKIMFDSLQQSKPVDMIKGIHSLLEEADVVIHYNGCRFDIPTLNKEFILFGLTPPSNYKEVDLLRVARQRFRFTSNKLDYIAGVLGLGNKVQHKGMDLWRDCMNGDSRSWQIMERYNKQDVKLLEKLYDKMLPWIKNHPNYGLYLDSNRPVCRNCGSSKVKKNGLAYTQVGLYQRYKCLDCGTPLRGSTLLNSTTKRQNLLR